MLVQPPHSGRAVVMNSSKPRRGRRIVGALLVPVAVLLAGAIADPPGVTAKPKVIDLTPPSRYFMTVNGNFKVTKGDAVEEGTISAPNIPLTYLASPGTGKVMFGVGDGRVPDSLHLAANCELRGTVNFTLTAGPAGTNGNDVSEVVALSKKVAVPTGSVGLSLNGVASGLTAMTAKGDSVTEFELQGIQKMTCTIGDPPQEVKATLVGQALTEALAAANLRPLIFKTKGETVTRKSAPGANPSYLFTFSLTTKKTLG